MMQRPVIEKEGLAQLMDYCTVDVLVSAALEAKLRRENPVGEEIEGECAVVEEEKQR